MQRPSPYLLAGGLDLISPAVAKNPGYCIGSMNYEPVAEGYARIGGYERRDGRLEPHLAGYWLLRFTGGTAAASVGATVEGGTSHATALILADAVIESGSYGTSDAVGYLVLTEVSGTFQPAEDIEVAATPIAVAAGVAQAEGAPTDEENTEYRVAAVSRRRALIGAVPGSGPVRGVFNFRGKDYAIRDDAGGTAGVLHVSSSSGWVPISPNPIVMFDTGTARFVAGETLTQGGTTATIREEITTGGGYGTSDATGYLVLSGVTGGNFAAGIAASASGSAALLGAQAAPAIPPGGKYDWASRNFGGATSEEKLFFAGGVGRAFQYSPGSGTLSVIRAIPEDALDKPAHVATFQNHLFLGYANGACLFSGLGAPLDFRTTAGAGEVNLGGALTGFSEASKTALIIFGDNRINYLVGTSASDFQMLELTLESGAREWTTQGGDHPTYQDAIGLRDLSTTSAFGGWQIGTLTQPVEPLIQRKLRLGVQPVASVLAPGKAHYRLFFSDKSGITLYRGRKRPEAMPFSYPMKVACASRGVGADGRDILLVGAEDGFVYRLDVGTSFDGAPIPAFLRTAYNHCGSPYFNKRFHWSGFELIAAGDVMIKIAAEFGYGDSHLSVGVEQDPAMSAGGGVWNDANWDEFYWSAREQGLATVRVDGLGPNISLAVISKTSTEAPHVLQALVHSTTMRGPVRQ